MSTASAATAPVEHTTTVTPIYDGSQVATVGCTCGWNGGDRDHAAPVMSLAGAERSAAIHTRHDTGRHARFVVEAQAHIENRIR